MSKAIQAIRGMNDILPANTPVWHYLESQIHALMKSYAYEEIRFPIVEQTALFKRSIGEVTDIVEKEMYTFEDRNGDSLTLRPEGTACCVRAGIENGLLYNQLQKLWYMGPLFRHERPQKGRYRQFHQLGVEAFGYKTPAIDAELILMCARFWQQLGLTPYVKLEINSLGTPECRVRYRDALVDYFKQHEDQLDEDSKNRLTRNPLRILDSKNPDMKALNDNAPKLEDYLSDESKNHIEMVCKILKDAGVEYTLNPHLVRGLDYYCHTVFEWVTDHLGAQGTVCAGGRYDNLVEQLGGKPTSASGFAIGLERLAALLEDLNLLPDVSSAPDVYMILVGEAALEKGVIIAEQLRNKNPALNVYVNCTGAGFKSQFKKADASGARLAVILGDDEIEQNKLSVKYLREDKPQAQMTLDEFVSEL